MLDTLVGKGVAVEPANSPHVRHAARVQAALRTAIRLL
jgi:hypothetical protein